MKEKIEINITCKDLPKFDRLSASDPKVFLFMENNKNNNKIDSEWEEIGSTETVKDDNNPVFKKSFILDYYPDKIQNLRFLIFDMDDESEEWKKNDFIGYMEKSITALLSGSVDKIYTCDLLTGVPSGFNINNDKAKKNSGTAKMILRVEKITGKQRKLRFSVSGNNLDKKDVFGKSDPFIIISLNEDNGKQFKIFETEVRKNTLNPIWENIEIPVKTFNKGDPDKVLTFEVYDWDKDTSNDLIGTFKATTNDLFVKKEFEVINEELRQKGNYKNSGVVVFNKIEYVN